MSSAVAHTQSSAHVASTRGADEGAKARDTSDEQEAVHAAITKVVGSAREPAALAVKGAPAPMAPVEGGDAAPPAAPAREPAPQPEAAAPSFQVDQDMETLSTISRHMDKVPDSFEFEDLDAMSKDETLPEDLRQAYADLRDDPELLARLDNLGNHGIGWRFRQDDHKLGKGDFTEAFKDPALQAYNEKKAEAFAKNYVPSDAPPDQMQPREITESDAARELYLYSESLPEDIDREDLEAITRGQTSGKCPPQVIAAAQYMLDHPESWKKIAADGSASRGELEQNAAPLIRLHEEERAAIDVVKSDPESFMKDGVITRESLLEKANDESAPMEERQAAAILLSSPVAFGLLDNASQGHVKDGANDGKIGKNDLDALKLSKTNTAPPPADVPRGSTGDEALDDLALQQMLDGTSDDPATKQVRDNSRMTRFLRGLSKVLDVVKGALDAVASVLPPGLSSVVSGISTAVAAVDKFAVEAKLDMRGGMSKAQAMAQAGKEFGMEAAASAASMLPGGAALKGAVVGAKQAAVTGAREAGEVALKQGLKQGIESGAQSAARQGMESGLQQGVRQNLDEGAQSAAQRLTKESAEPGSGRVAGRASRESLEEGGEAGWKSSVKDTVKETVQEEVTVQAQSWITQKTGMEFGGGSEGGEGVGRRRGRGGDGFDHPGRGVDRSDEVSARQPNDPPRGQDVKRDDDGRRGAAADKDADGTRREEKPERREQSQKGDAGQPSAASSQPVDYAALEALMLLAAASQRLDVRQKGIGKVTAERIDASQAD